MREMAETLWEAAARGFTDLFDATYADNAGKVMVMVSLRLVDPTSSSSSGTDWREGSVPSVNGGSKKRVLR